MILTSLIAALVTTTVLALLLHRTHINQHDLVAGLRESIQYEAIALYNNNDSEPVFEFVPDRFGELLGRLRSPIAGDRHWDYWRHFRQTRQDWDHTIRRVLRTGHTERRRGEVLIYPGGKTIVIDWTCGPRYNYRWWRGRGVCGFYITHCKSQQDPNPDIESEIESMRQHNTDLEAQIQDSYQKHALASAQRLVERFETNSTS